MSRSRKKTPITANTYAESARVYKKIRAGTERAHQRNLIHDASLGDEVAAEALEVERQPWNEWECERDGKHWIGDRHPKLMRK